MCTLAISRIYLDNFPHITAYWIGLGMKLAQVALSYGADDIHGTIIEEHIFHMAGATSPQLQTEADMIKAIRETGPHASANEIPSTNPSRCWPMASAGGEVTENSAHSKVLEDNPSHGVNTESSPIRPGSGLVFEKFLEIILRASCQYQ